MSWLNKKRFIEPRTFDVSRKHFPTFSLDNYGRLQAKALLVVAPS